MGHDDQFDELTALYSSLAETQPVMEDAAEAMGRMAASMAELSGTIATEAKKTVARANEALLRSEKARQWLDELSHNGGTFPAIEGKTAEESLRIFLENY